MPGIKYLTKTKESRPIDKLVPYARNARTHSDAQVSQLAASMREWGFVGTVLVTPDDGIIAGHGRVMALRYLGEETVPVTVAQGWSQEQIKAFILADNQLAMNAGWDENLLKLEIQELNVGEFDLDLIGFSGDDISNLLTDDSEGDPSEDELPEIPEVAASHPGDIWLLGEHRLICGDSTSPDDVVAVLNGAKPNLMVTDPPYGVEYSADWRNEALRSDGTPSNGRAVGRVRNDHIADWSPSWALFEGNIAYIWHASIQTDVVAASIMSQKFEKRALIIWAKNVFAIGRGNYHHQHEPCWYMVRKGKAANWKGGRKQTTIWNIDKPQKSETGHSTQKPLECMSRPIKNNSAAGDAVYEPFCGSGTTVIACEKLGRVCHAVEIHPPYCDVIVKRWQEYTGKQAIREADGAKFDDIVPKVEADHGDATTNAS